MNLLDVGFLALAVTAVAIITLTHRVPGTGESILDDLREWWNRRNREGET